MVSHNGPRKEWALSVRQGYKRSTWNPAKCRFMIRSTSCAWVHRMGLGTVSRWAAAAPRQGTSAGSFLRWDGGRRSARRRRASCHPPSSSEIGFQLAHGHQGPAANLQHPDLARRHQSPNRGQADPQTSRHLGEGEKLAHRSTCSISGQSAGVQQAVSPTSDRMPSTITCSGDSLAPSRFSSTNSRR